ncbi:hypothetical protein [Rhizobium sp. FY34]|uniref:hypothetical protein n=1 Tax=Rhizobium sp. FY34 TaxID=2562309 RepID=UPI0010C0F57C|nr:hypothetical protein [Rhizobium sp. FY34]
MTMVALGFVGINQAIPSDMMYILSMYLAVVGILYAAFMRDPLAGVIILLSIGLPYVFFDPASRFLDGQYYEVQLNYGYFEFLNMMIESVKGRVTSGDNQIRGAFLVMIYPFLKVDAIFENFKFVPYNSLLIFGCAVVLRLLASDFCERHNMAAHGPLVAKLTFYAFLLSPTSIFFSADLLKDQTSMFTVLLSTLLFVRRRYVLFALVVLAASLVRSYNPLTIACFILAVDRPKKIYLLGGGVLLLGLLALVRGSPAAVVNMVASSVYVYVNPLPIRLSNWLPPVTLLTLQGVVFSVAWVGAMYQLFDARSRRMGLDRLTIAIALFGCILIAVGYNNAVNFNETEYGIGTGGDNMTRKCFPILPLICMQLSIVVARFARQQQAGRFMTK